MLDAVIVGGGLIGLASALELADAGLRACVIDSGAPGQASFAAAGILGPQSESAGPGPMLDLCRASFALYPGLAARLGDVGLRNNGTLHLAFSEAEEQDLARRRDWQVEAGLRALDPRGVGAGPAQHPGAGARLAVFFPDEGQVDNRKLLLLLREACLRAGVELVQGTASAVERDRVLVAGPGGASLALRAGAVVLCAGAWSQALGPLLVSPVRGQMLALERTPPACVVFGAGGYLVPRGERTLVGATMERAGFAASTTDAGRAHLLSVAARLQPGLEQAPLADHWSGLRPSTPDGLPLLGALPSGVLVAAGHHRNGVLLTPISARIVLALVRGDAPPLDLAPFSPARPAPPAAAL